MSDLTNWAPCPRPQRQVLEGRFVHLEPFDAATHGADLHPAATAADAEERFAYLPVHPAESLQKFQPWS